MKRYKYQKMKTVIQLLILTLACVCTVTNAAFDTQPASTAITATSITLSATPSANVNVKCGAFVNDATAPTADELYANTGNGGAAVAANNGPVVNVVTGNAAGAGSAITGIAISGLTANTAYDIVQHVCNICAHLASTQTTYSYRCALFARR